MEKQQLMPAGYAPVMWKKILSEGHIWTARLNSNELPASFYRGKLFLSAAVIAVAVGIAIAPVSRFLIVKTTELVSSSKVDAPVVPKVVDDLVAYAEAAVKGTLPEAGTAQEYVNLIDDARIKSVIDGSTDDTMKPWPQKGAAWEPGYLYYKKVNDRTIGFGAKVFDPAGPKLLVVVSRKRDTGQWVTGGIISEAARQSNVVAHVPMRANFEMDMMPRTALALGIAKEGK